MISKRAYGLKAGSLIVQGGPVVVAAQTAVAKTAEVQAGTQVGTVVGGYCGLPEPDFRSSQEI